MPAGRSYCPNRPSQLNLKAGPSKVDTAITLSARQIVAEPDHHYRDGSVRIALDGLHRETLSDWLQAVLAAHQAGLRGKFLLEKARGDALLALPALLAHRPSIRIEPLRLISPAGEASAQFEIALHQAPPPGLLRNPALLIEVATAKGRIQLPQSLARHWAALQARAELGPSASVAAITTASEELLLRLRANQPADQPGQQLSPGAGAVPRRAGAQWAIDAPAQFLGFRGLLFGEIQVDPGDSHTPFGRRLVEQAQKPRVEFSARMVT